MASIRQRADTWQARVRRIGFPEEVWSFKTKAEAQTWARTVEAGMDQDTHQVINAAGYTKEQIAKDLKIGIASVYCILKGAA
jgi:L-2-hydroxyglutarate oxidase LhgO